MMNSVHQAIIPGLPDDLALRCLAKVSHGYHGLLEAVSKRWRDVIHSSDYSNYKAREGWCGNWLFVLTEGPKNQWVAYDPEADRWHPLPKISRAHSEWQHNGFSCVGVFNRFLVIGGSYAPHDLGFSHQRPLVTNDVLQFDPFKKQWSRLASMRTPRSHFACSVVSGKVFVAGGRSTSSCTRGLALAEVYDPLNDKLCSVGEDKLKQLIERMKKLRSMECGIGLLLVWYKFNAIRHSMFKELMGRYTIRMSVEV